MKDIAAVVFIISVISFVWYMTKLSNGRIVTELKIAKLNITKRPNTTLFDEPIGPDSILYSLNKPEAKLFMSVETYINQRIKDLKADTNLISDGYHTFGELYEHRIALFIALCSTMVNWGYEHSGDPCVWRSKKHSDGSEWEGWFILGMYYKAGSQMTYHLPISKWDETEFAETLDRAPEWDGHTSSDVLERLKTL